MLLLASRRVSHRLTAELVRRCHAAAPLGSSTAAIHADALGPETWQFSTAADVSPPISMATTYTVPGESGGHVYNRTSSPGRSRCEALLAAVEGTADAPVHAVLYSTGLAATFGALSRLLPRRVAVSGGYHGTHQVLDQLRRISGGASFESVPLPRPDELGASELRAGDVVWLETPLNPTCEVADIAAYVAAARAIGGVRVVVDGTFAPPPLQRPLALGADVVMHSTTKSLSGHSDALGGALCVREEGLAEELRADRGAVGSTPGALETWLLTRSLRTLHLRVARQSATAAALASWLHAAAGGDAAHPLAGLVASVRHPSLPSDPSHEAAARQMSGGYGGVFAIELATEKA